MHRPRVIAAALACLGTVPGVACASLHTQSYAPSHNSLFRTVRGRSACSYVCLVEWPARACQAGVSHRLGCVCACRPHRLCCACRTGRRRPDGRGDRLFSQHVDRRQRDLGTRLDRGDRTPGRVAPCPWWQPAARRCCVLHRQYKPVAFGVLGLPALSATVGRQMPVLALLVPFILLAVVSGRRSPRRAWLLALVAGVAHAGMQVFDAATLPIGLVSIVAAQSSKAASMPLLRNWKSAHGMTAAGMGPLPMGTVVTTSLLHRNPAGSAGSLPGRVGLWHRMGPQLGDCRFLFRRVVV